MQIAFPGRCARTMFWDIQPYTILIKSVLIRIEAFQRAAPTGRIIRVLIHRGILLMAENDPFAGAAFSAAFATLRTLGLLLITYPSLGLSPSHSTIVTAGKDSANNVHLSFRVRQVKLHDTGRQVSHCSRRTAERCRRKGNNFFA